MAPTRPRAVDDSRSETSSTITNLKERSAHATAAGAGISKNKRLASHTLNGTHMVNKGPVEGAAAAPEDSDPNLPRVEWTTLSTSILHTYRIAHRLTVPSSYTHPHAEVTYNSSTIALRAPSAVFARKRLSADLKHQRRAQAHPTDAHTNGFSKASKAGKASKTKEKDKDASSRLLKHAVASNNRDGDDPTTSTTTSAAIAQSIERPDSPSFPSQATYRGSRQTQSALATAVRKHFNAQQLNEAETIARFVYVVQQTRGGVSTERGKGDGTGYWMGSHGRQVRKIDAPGGETGFRLRFRP